MNVVKTLRPGAPGTQRFTQRFGDRLVCVRYRHDRRRGYRLTTVEVVVDSAPLPLDVEAYRVHPLARHRNSPVLVRIEAHETHLQRKVRNAGGRWWRECRAWKLPYREAVRLGLEPRIITGDEDKPERCINPPYQAAISSASR